MLSYKRKIYIFMEKMRRYYIKMLAGLYCYCVCASFSYCVLFCCGSFSFPIFSTLEYVLLLNRNNQLYFKIAHDY